MGDTTQQKKNSEKNPLWKYPWRYRESFFISAELLIIGFAFELFTKGKGVEPIKWPLNLIIGISFILILLSLRVLFRKHPIIKWFSSIPAAISSLSLFTLMVLLLGFLSQNDQQASILIRSLGLSHVKNSWPFVIAQIYLLTTLGFVTIRRASPLTRKNLGFLLNHAGLWIALSTATLGAGDLKRWYINIYEDKDFVPHAYDDNRNLHELPFAVKLIDFDIEEYNPKIGIAEWETGNLLNAEGLNPVTIEKGLNVNFSDWDITIEEFLHSAITENGKYILDDESGAAPAALITSVNRVSGDTVFSWISCGSFILKSHYISLNEKYFLAMIRPQAKKFSSLVEIKSDKNIIDTVTIEVNKPHKIMGWRLYQLNYDQDMGKWSNLSVLEVVKDPWLPIVYIGIFLVLAGAFYIFWIGKDIKE